MFMNFAENKCKKDVLFEKKLTPLQTKQIIEKSEKLNVQPARFFTAARMLPLIEKVKAYEDEVAREKQTTNKKKPTEIPPEVNY